MRIIYFDNAATTFQKPGIVLRQTLKFIREGYGNAGRSGHFLSMKTAELIYETREVVCRMLNFNAPDKVIFHHNATEALNVAIKACIPDNSHILTSNLEHNSVLRPLYSLSEKKGIKIGYFSHSGNLENNIVQQIRSDTKAIVCTLVSNVTGEEIDISVLSRIRKKYNLLLIVDASQMFAHKSIDLNQTPVDVLCSAGHKGAFGMQGVGFSVYNKAPDKTFIEGGSGVDSFLHTMPNKMPERLEAGTLSAPAIASLKYGLTFIEKYGIRNVEEKLAEFDFIANCEFAKRNHIISLANGKNGIHSFVFQNESSSQTARKLEKFNICVRSGFHCAPLTHKLYHTEQTGAIRMSFSIMNTKSEIRKFFQILDKIKA